MATIEYVPRAPGLGTPAYKVGNTYYSDYSRAQQAAAAQSGSSSGSSTPKTTTTTTTPSTTTTTGGGSYGGGGSYVTDATGKQVYIPPLTKDIVDQAIAGISDPAARAQAQQAAATTYPGWYSPASNMTQTQATQNVNDVINQLLAQIANMQQQIPSVSYPSMPQYYSPSPTNLAGEPPLTWEQATQRATEMVNPLAEAARTRTIQMFQEQREKLPYQLAAKGQLSQGALRNAEEALTQAQALALEQIDMQKLAQALETARQLQTTTQEQAAANLATQWQQWLAQQEANLQRAQLTATEQWRQYEAKRNILAQLVAWLMQQQGLERADELAALQAALQISPFITNPLAFAQSYGYWPAAS